MSKPPMSTKEMQQEEGLWDANDVGRFVKASRSWVYQQVKAGRLPCVKIGGLLRFDPAAIRAFIKGQERRALESGALTRRQ